MTTLYDIYDGDAYAVDVSPQGDVTQVLRFLNNQQRHPVIEDFADLDEELQDKLNSRIAKLPLELPND